jgi:hypothetical protein
MSTTDKPKFARPAGWKDGGAVWLKSSLGSAGLCYKCKSCGMSGRGYGAANNVDAHSDDCPVTATKRAVLAANAALTATNAASARAKLYDTDWSAMSDALVIRLAALLP